MERGRPGRTMLALQRVNNTSYEYVTTRDCWAARVGD